MKNAKRIPTPYVSHRSVKSILFDANINVHLPTKSFKLIYL